MRPSVLAAIAALGLIAADDPKPNDEMLGARPPEGAKVLFDGKSLDGWVHRDGKPATWPVSDGLFTVKPRSGDIKTKEEFGSFTMHVEFNIPYMPDAKGQARGNSGIYLQGRYEVQVLDSYGLDSQDNDCGGIYKQYAPSVNACKPPLQWQTYDITFHAPKIEGGKQSEPARVTIVQNGVNIQDDRPIEPTPGGLGPEPAAEGPILLQDHHNAVQFRNIWLAPLD